MNWKRIPESQGWVQRVGEWAIRQRTFMPRMLDLEVSRVCNLSCPACMRRAPSSLAQCRPNEKFCSLDRFREIYSEVPTIGTLNFMGDGEPLMNPELQDIIHYASLNNIYTVVTTNGTLITDKILRHWKNNKVYRIHMSVDAATKVKYEEMRLGAEWERTLSNLWLVGHSGINLCVNTILLEHNMEEMPKMVQLCKEVGAKAITFAMPICTYGSDIGLRPSVNGKNEVLFRETRDLCKALGIRWVFPLNLNPTFRRFNFPFGRPEISMEGDIYACCYSLGRGKVWYEGYGYDVPSYNMGNMFKEGFRKIWYGEKYNALRQMYKDSEVRKGTTISRGELLVRTLSIMENDKGKLFDHCLICQARWGMACS